MKQPKITQSKGKKKHKQKGQGTGTTKKLDKTGRTVSNIPLFNLTQYSKIDPQTFKGQKCTICQFEFQLEDKGQIIKMRDCLDHYYHKPCIEAMAGTNPFVKCPVCLNIYGFFQGDQPPGKMKINLNPGLTCEGSQEGTIVIQYDMKSGTRNGVHFPGTHRTAYLPNSTEGKEIAELLRVAFDRKLIFTVGRSVTTGRENVIVWNGIHHKTNLGGGAAYFGYPDQTYFRRVKEELALKGIR